MSDSDNAKLERLALERKRLWKKINKTAPPSATNDWLAFAQANAAWERAWRNVHAEPEYRNLSPLYLGWKPRPPEDEIAIKSASYYETFCKKQTHPRSYQAVSGGKTLDDAITVQPRSDEAREHANSYRREKTANAFALRERLAADNTDSDSQEKKGAA